MLLLEHGSESRTLWRQLRSNDVPRESPVNVGFFERSWLLCADIEAFNHIERRVLWVERCAAVLSSHERSSQTPWLQRSQPWYAFQAIRRKDQMWQADHLKRETNRNAVREVNAKSDYEKWKSQSIQFEWIWRTNVEASIATATDDFSEL